MSLRPLSCLAPVFLAFAALLFLAACGDRETVVIEEPEAPVPDEDINEGPAEPLAPLFIGVWAADAEACDVPPGRPGPVVFTAGRFLGYENTCDIVSTEEGTDGGWRLSMTCMAEGETVEEVADVDVNGDKLRVSRNGGDPVEFVRCDTDQSPE